MSEHLTADLWGRIARGERFGDEKRLAAHLRGGCETCEALVAGIGQADGLDGTVDRALMALRPPPVRPNEFAFEKVMRAAYPAEAAPPVVASVEVAALRRRRGPSKSLPLALAATLVLGATAILALKATPRHPLYQGEKGSGSLPEVNLSFVVTGAVEGEALSRGTPGASYPADRAVMLRYDLSTPAFVMLLRIDARDRLEVLAQPGRLGAGPHDLRVNDMPAGVSLMGSVGRNRFLVVASASPLTAEQVTTVARSIGDSALGSEGLPTGELGISWFDIDVTPEAR